MNPFTGPLVLEDMVVARNISHGSYSVHMALSEVRISGLYA